MTVADPIFDTLVTEHQTRVLRVCRSILRDDHLGADAAQETFLRLWRHVVEDRAPERAGPWLRRVAVTTSLDVLRRKRSRPDTRDAEAPVEERPELAVERAPDDEAGSRELLQRFEVALLTLPEGQRTVFLLKHSGGLTLSEVAETLDVSVPTVKTQFARACLRLARALKSYRPVDRPEDRPPPGDPS
jgi:RNA polymerase sigma-70 factor (ECF subfamily)